MHTRLMRQREALQNGNGQTQAVVLVVDDDPGLTIGLAAMLNTAGYRAEQSHGYDEALETLRRVKPDLVISDVNLRGRSGLELCEQARGEEALASIPWMFLSGLQVPDIIRRAHQAGGAYYLRKPFDPDVLLELVDRALETSRTVTTPTQA